MINLAIIGCGRISYKHVRAAVDNKEKIKLTAVCDIDAKRAEQRAKEYSDGICSGSDLPKIYTDYRKMVDLEKIDLIAICTESGYHAEQAIYCMSSGRHVIVEKPMALSTRDADDMISAAAKNNVKLSVSHQNRFNPAVIKLREALEKGRFGRIIAGSARILWNRGEEYYKQAPWRGTYELDGGCLMNQCIHNIDLLQWMLGGQIDWLNADVGNYIHPYIEAEDYGSIQIKFKNGVIGNVEGTICIFPSNLEETLTVIGEKGVVGIGGLAVNKIETWRFEDGLDLESEILAKYNSDVDTVYGNGHTPLYEDVINAIINNTEPFINGNEGKKAMEIILAAYKSSRDRSRIFFPVTGLATIDFK